ncbi:MAG TPA: HIT domain-containing protein [Chloroflexota bacterium]|nr:HIT domain-containing protein [Chloroflexota bacterium]
MERLWTPWRRAFVEADGTHLQGCFLCTKPAEHNDRQNLIVYRGPLAYVLLNLYPYNNGHLLIAPYAHTGDLAKLETSTASELMQLTQHSVDVLQRVYHPHGFNVGMYLGKSAGAGVPDHVHVHVVPRWEGDTNFMPVLADTKVLPESLAQSYDRLEPSFRS